MPSPTPDLPRDRASLDNPALGRPLRIVFLGTPEFAATCLERLLETRHEVVGVVTAPDRPAGRGRSLRASEVKEVALKHGLPLAQPEKLRDEEFLAQLEAWNPDLGVVVAFRMLPEVVWNRPPLGTVNLHGSLLPQYRGAAPIHWAVLNGETVTGASTFLLKHEIDTGHVLGRVEIPVGPDDTTGLVHDRLLEAGKHLLAETVESLASGTARAVPQEELLPAGTERKEAPKLFKDHGQIDWTRSADDIHNQVRGLNPFPGAWTTLPDGTTLRVHATAKSDLDLGSAPGTVHASKDRMTVQCGTGALDLLRIQPQGKPVLAVKDFLNGLRTPLRNLGKA
ncbi:MAG: methionyl-tRNA formyltransferase [Flavobacteriales bacterium]